MKKSPSVEKMPGHWLLASLGKRVLRPGGLELTCRLLEELACWIGWLRSPGLLRLAGSDGPLLVPLLKRLVQEAHGVQEETEACLSELSES